MILQISVMVAVVITVVVIVAMFRSKNTRLEIPGYTPTRSHFIFNSKGTVLCIEWNKIDSFRYDNGGPAGCTLVIEVGKNTHYIYSTHENIVKVVNHMTTRC